MSLVPALFDVGAFEVSSSGPLPMVDTPLGQFSLTLDLEPPLTSAETARLRARDIDLFIWDGPTARVELRVAKPDLQLPDGMAVSDVRAAVWRIRSRRPLVKVELSCELEGVTRSPSFETGQGLDSMAWEANGVRLSLGTPDAEALLHYAGDGAPYPKSWIAARENTDTIPQVDYGPRGLRVSLPPLTPDELAQTHFVLAWAPAGAGSEATYWAVDQSPWVLLPHREPAV